MAAGPTIVQELAVIGQKIYFDVHNASGYVHTVQSATQTQAATLNFPAQTNASDTVALLGEAQTFSATITFGADIAMGSNQVGGLSAASATGEAFRYDEAGDRLYTDGNVATDSEAFTASIEALSVAIGNRTYTSQFTVTNSGTMTASLDAIDLAIGSQNFTNDYLLTDQQSVTASLDALDTACGNQTYTNDHVVIDAETFTASIDSLDTEIYNLTLTTSGNGASKIGIYDVATNYTATDVEAALAEVYTLASSGSNNWTDQGTYLDPTNDDTNTIRVGDGSAGAPSYATKGFATSGMFCRATTTVAFAANGAEVASFDANGMNLGTASSYNTIRTGSVTLTDNTAAMIDVPSFPAFPVDSTLGALVIFTVERTMTATEYRWTGMMMINVDATGTPQLTPVYSTAQSGDNLGAAFDLDLNVTPDPDEVRLQYTLSDDTGNATMKYTIITNMDN